jgi:hypothetical protein
MSYSQVRAVIKSTLEGISTIEKVQDYSRHTVDWDEIATFFKDTNNRIHVWIIEWNNTDNVLEAVGTRVYSYNHNITLWGLYGLKDSEATQKTFEDEVDTVLDTFNALEWLLSGSTRIARQNEPAVLANLDHATLSDVLCHRAQIDINYNEQRVYS